MEVPSLGYLEDRGCSNESRFKHGKRAHLWDTQNTVLEAARELILELSRQWRRGSSFSTPHIHE